MLALTITSEAPILVERNDDLAVVAEIILLTTDPDASEATIEVRSGGEKKDMQALGVRPGAQSFTLAPSAFVEVLPGLRMCISEDQRVTPASAKLAFDDPPRVWDIQREVVHEKMLRDLFRAGKLKRLSFKK